jgi:hypothetical protein
MNPLPDEKGSSDDHPVFIQPSTGAGASKTNYPKNEHETDSCQLLKRDLHERLGNWFIPIE